ncbi:ATP-binding protein [Oligoflexus tunisiensis]|uniref:ATP-binding protein n=1 Tax=Oligoflexus tunisiensis TaxID=708132 RepID=UPI00114D0088|nr:ATP-binding protein [Oligoflexus tunisiensis]
MDSKKFLAFWGWKNLPWNEPVALDRLYWQESTQIICSRLLLTLQRAASLFVITAPPGHGKSTLARWLYHNVDQDRHDVAFFSLLQTEQGSGWLLPKLAQYLGLDPATSSNRTVLARLQQSRLHGKILTVIIDDAHKLKEPEALDEILALIQVQSIAANHVNFILIGNPRLSRVIQMTEGCQHRLALLADMQALSRNDIIPYLNWRLDQIGLPAKVVGADAHNYLMAQAPLSFAWLESLLEGALMEAFLRDQRVIVAETMQAAVQYFGWSKGLAEEPSTELPKPTKPASGRRKPTPQTGKSGGAVTPTLDLNSLYYKSGGGHDPEES